MIPYTGEPMHERAIEGIVAILGRLRTVPEHRRCVACDVADGGDRGWCGPCGEGLFDDDEPERPGS